MGRSTATIQELVTRAREGDGAAWDELVERFLPLVFAVLSRFRLARADADDVNQTVWLRLVEHLDGLREAEALPGWIATTTRNEALKVIRKRDRQLPVDPAGWRGFADDSGPLDEGLLADERRHALREGLAQISPERRELLLLLLHDPPIPYAEISVRLGRPVGWIGPTRARALEELRATPAFRSMLATEGGEARP
jgi:RNA polymerase sigma factor (sigma-70 family)